MVRTPIEDIDAMVLDHVARYRLTLPRALAATKILGTTEAGSAETKLRALVSSGWLNEAPLCPGTANSQSYFYLSARAAAFLVHDLAWSFPVKRDMRVECFARLMFCCTGKAFRQLFTKAEFVSQFAQLWFSGQPVQYYIEPATDQRPARLAFLKVDKDGEGRWDRLIDSCARFLRQRITPKGVAPEFRPHVAAFGEFVRRGQFQFTVLTALPDKKHAISLELERRQNAGHFVPLIETHVVDGLFDLLCPSPQ